jgi:excisionase family DNA binding protein
MKKERRAGLHRLIEGERRAGVVPPDLLADPIGVRSTTKMAPPLSADLPTGAEPFPRPSLGEWLTAREAARYLRMNLKALYTAVGRRQIPASRLGRRLRFHRDGLDHLLRNGPGNDRMKQRVPSPGKAERW